MTVMTVIRDAQGRVINIGAWDYTPIDPGVVTNPLPAGAYEDTADVVEGWDGGLYLADDPRKDGPA